MESVMATQQTQQAVVPGGFWIRFVAVIVDALIVNIIQFPIALVLGIYSGLNTTGTVNPADVFTPGRIALYLGSMTIGFVVQFFYCALFYRSKGATPGKMLLGLKVVDAQTGAYIGFGQTFLRECVGKTVSMAVFMIGFIMAGLRSDKRALHDLMAGTQVIRKS